MAQPLVALQAVLPQLADPTDIQMKAYKLRDLAAQAQLADQTMADDRGARAAFSANPTDGAARLAALANVSPKAYSDEVKRQAETAKSSAQTRTAQIEAAHKSIDLAGQAFGYVRNNPTPENAMSAINWLTQQGVYTPEQSQQYSAMVQSNPAGIKAMADQAFSSALDTKSQLPKLETRDTGGEVQTLAIDPLTGAPRVTNTITKTQTPDSIASNQRMAAEGAANRAQQERASLRADSRAREQAENGRAQVLQTDSGPLLVNTKTGTSRPVLGADGQAVSAKLKDVPAAIRKTVVENDAALRKVDQALAAINDYPDALGVKNYLGDTVRQRTDPRGVEARALVADIGSLKLHDRSGAAVTASETPRLKPFIPTATDDIATVRKKLGLFRKEYDAIQSDLKATYSRDQGYRAPADSGGVPEDIADLLRKHGGK